MEKKKIAVIRIRGKIGIKREARETFKMLRLYKKNYLIILDNNPYNIGMLNKIKDYSTWGEISIETFKLLIEKRARLAGNKKLTSEYLKEKLKMDLESFAQNFFESKKSLKDIPGIKLFFRLCPPRKGFEQKGVKVPFSLGGVLGYRKEKINDLLVRML